MFSRIKELNARRRELKAGYGRGAAEAVIEAKINGDALNGFAAGEEMISGEFADYLLQKSRVLPLRKDIEIVLEGEDDLKDRVKTGVVNYFEKSFADYDRQLTSNGIVSLVFIGMAVLIFALMFTLKALTNMGEILLEIMDIAGWVFAWETVDMFFIQRKIIKIKMLRSYNLLKARIK